MILIILPIMGFSKIESNTMDLPIIMYHAVSKNKSSKYVVTVDQLENDFQAIKDAGFTPVFMNDVIDWLNGSGTLPKKPIVITFDDGQYNNLSYVLPIAKKYNFKYLINPVTSFSEESIIRQETDNSNYSYLSWANIKEGLDSGLVEFGNHTANLHKLSPRYGISKLKNETNEEYKILLKEDINNAQKLLTEAGVKTPNTFAYPFGKYTSQAQNILIDMGFKALLTCTEEINKIQKNKPESLYQLGRFNRSGNYTTSQFIKKISE